MQIDGSFVGRDRELAQLELAVGPGDDGLRLVMLTGPSGLGKTTLANVAIDRARAKGRDVRLAGGRAGSLSTPFNAWLEAFPELADTMGEAVMAGSAVDMEQIGVQLVAVLARLASTAPLLLVFDDAQALDESSIALLSYATGVSERMNLTLMFIEQSDAIDVPNSYRSFADTLLARRVVHNMRLGPMSDESIQRLAAYVLGLDDVDDVPAEIVLRAGGNPWFAKELAESLQRGESEIPVSIAAAATSRLKHLSETTQDVVFAVSLCPEGAHIGWLESVAGEKPREFVRTMERITSSGLVREEGEFVTIAHPLMRQALLDELSAAMRRALHQELATAIASTPLGEVTSSRALGYHLSLSGHADQAVAHYLRAAEVNEIQGKPHEALFDYVRALDVEPRIDQRSDLLRRCAFAAMQTGSATAGEYWSELGRIAAARHDNETYAYALFHQYWSAYDGTALDRLERAAALGPEKYGWSARAAACLKTLSADYRGSIEHDLVALDLARAAGDDTLEAIALEKIGIAYAYTGRLTEAIEMFSQAVAKNSSQRLHQWAVDAWWGLIEVLGMDLQIERALAESRAAAKYVTDLGLHRYEPMVEASLARTLMWAGQLEESQRHADAAMLAENSFSNDRHSALVACIRAEVAVEAGDVSMAATAIDRSLDLATHQGYASWIFEAELERARFLALSGNVLDAVELASTLEIDERSSMVALGLWLARTGVLHENATALDRARMIMMMPGEDTSPLTMLAIDEITALLADDSPEKVDALCAIADRWREGGRVVYAYRALTAMATTQVRLGQVPQAIEALSAARSGFVKCGASADADYVAGRLRGLGTRTRAKSRSTDVGNLTKRELEIARLVASGLRNSEVASQLYLAEKTVAAHLSNIYGKLEVRSRVHLAGWLKEHDPDMSVAS